MPAKNEWWKTVKKKGDVNDGQMWQACETPEGDTYYYNTVTKETSWDKPQELMSSDEAGGHDDYYWAPDQEQVYAVAKMVESDGKTATVEYEDDGREEQHACKDLQKMQKSSLGRAAKVDDLVLLDEMSFPLILYALRKRFESNQIYTAVGTITISINPYQVLPLYTDSVRRKYMQRGPADEMPPHVYNNAHEAFIGLTEFNNTQSIIISGESGAGKTEATKQCLSYLSQMAGSVGGVERKVQQANPILEAFGNAKTIRNDNSSRFGKYLQISFDDNNQICGSTTIQYLLEKIRVVNAGKNERNYHVFYQLVGYASSRQKKQFQLKGVKEYQYLTRGNCVTCANDDAKDFQALECAFQDLLFSQDDVEALYATLSAILALGNIDMGRADKAVIKGDMKNPWLMCVADMLKVPVDALKKSLVIRELRIRGQETTDVGLAPVDALNNRDALAKFVYGRMFEWIVMRVNNAMLASGGRNTPRTIGCLDIFGFEIFEDNSFEQLCINFTNEMLQQHFNQHTFKLEEQVYKKEGIQFEHIAFIDNQPMIELLTKKPNGVLPLLDEELRMPKATDKTYVDKLHAAHARNPVYGKPLKTADRAFVVKHYAGDVEYQIEGFLEKNKDSLTVDLMEMLQLSESPFINALFPPGQDDEGRKTSLGKQFHKQLDDLMVELNQTQPHYIRCIKPNSTKAKLKFESVMVFEQLTYSGVFEACNIRKRGFPFRLTHSDFAERYLPVMSRSGKGGKTECGQIVKFLKLNEQNVQMGRTMVLYRAEEHKKLELERNIKVKTVEVEQRLNKLIKLNVSNLSKEAKEQYYEDLSVAVRNADNFRMETKASERARAMLEKYIEERMDKKTKRMLETGLKTANRAMLEEGLAVCEEEGYRNKLTRDCEELLEKMVECDDELDAQLQTPSLPGIAAILEKCQRMKYNCPKVDELRRFEKKLRKVIDAMQAAIRKPSIETIENAMELADDINYREDPYPSLQGTLTKMKKAEDMIDDGLQGMDRPKLEEALKFCDSFGYLSPNVRSVEKMLRKMDEVDEECQGGIDNMNVDQLEEALYQANKINYSSGAVVQAAQQLYDRIKAVEDELASALKLFDPDQLEAVIAKCDDMGYNSLTAQQARDIVDQIHDINDTLDQGTLAMNENALQDALKECDEIGYNTPRVVEARELLQRIMNMEADVAAVMVTMDRAEMEAVLKSCDEWAYNSQSVRELRDNLQKGAIADDLCRQAIDMLNTVLMGDALREAERANYNGPLVKETRQLYDTITAIERMLADGQDLLDVNLLIDGIAEAERIGYSNDNVKFAVETRNKINQAEAMVADAQETNDSGMLRDAIAFCDTFGYNSPRVAEARETMDKYKNAIALLEECLTLREVKKRNVTFCDEALAAADAVGLVSPLIDQVIQRRKRLARPSSGPLAKRIRRIVQETNKALLTYDEGAIRAIVAAADKAEYDDDWVDYFRSLVNGPYEEFLDAQFNKALEMGNNIAAVKALVKRKSWLFKQTGDKYRVSFWSGLKTPDQWARSGFLGMVGRNDPSTMWAFQPNMIHSSMTHACKKRGKEVSFLFKTILSYMGQGAGADNSGEDAQTMVLNMLKACAEVPAIRDEMYCQCIKQLNQNSNVLYKGWMLIGVCLTVFPPSDGFTDHLAFFLEQNSDTDPFNCRALLQERMFQKRCGDLPTAEQLDVMYKLLENKSQELAPGEENEKDASWYDLVVASAPQQFHPGTEVIEAIERDGLLPANFGGANAYTNSANNFHGAGGNLNSLQGDTTIGQGAWIQRQDPVTGALFYYNTNTQESSWEKPGPSQQNAMTPSPGSPWVQEVDTATGVPYYFNTSDGTSVWECPDDF